VRAAKIRAKASKRQPVVKGWLPFASIAFMNSFLEKHIFVTSFRYDKHDSKSDPQDKRRKYNDTQEETGWALRWCSRDMRSNIF
jgi:hypothetical protein